MASYDEPLYEDQAGVDPWQLFARWFDEAAEHVRLPEAVALATADRDGRPSLRMVLIKDFGPEGLTFFTHYDSRKGVELGENPHGALLFYWDPFGRQVRIEGDIARLSDTESDAYFATRPRGAQIGAVASHQSKPITSRRELDEAVARVSTSLGQGVVKRPSTWGGYRLVAESFEFWQNRDDRLHDRLEYRRDPSGWLRARLQP